MGVGVVFFALTTAQGLTRPDFDAWHQAVSALSLGPGGWLQQVNLVGFGLAIVTTAPTWRRVLYGGRGAASYPVLMFAIGASFVGVGVIPQDPAPGYDPDHLALSAPTAGGLVHLALAGVAAASSVASLFVIANRLDGDEHWPRWAAYTRATAVAIIVSVVVYGVWSVKPSGLAGTFERTAIILPLAWTTAFLRKLSRGTPFMIAGNREP